MTRPNVLLIVSDDHGYGDRTVLGHHPDVVTPRLDRLAAEGVSCDSAYVTAPVCSPSRAGLIAGRYQQRWGARWFGNSHFPDHAPSLAERFSDAGYATAYYGKVHYGPEQPGDRACPPNHGFDECLYGLAGLSTGRLHYLHHSRSAEQEYGAAAQWHGVSPLLDSDGEVECEEFLTHALGARARDFIGRHTEEPFFCMVAFNAVHNFCWQLPEDELEKRGLTAHDDYDASRWDYADWYTDTVRPNMGDGRAFYLAQLELMDAEIGRILDQLEESGQADNTIVVYTTDNGGSPCNYGDNTPLAGSKYTVWEGGIRVPMIVRWPGGGVPAGEHRDGLVSSLDFTPTFLSAAGVDPSAWADSDGLDQLPLLRGERADGHEFLHWDTGFQWAVRDAEWKLAFVDSEQPEPAHLLDYEHADTGLGLRLHRVGTDVSEVDEVAEQYPEVVERLRAEHDRWAAATIGRDTTY